MGYAPGSYYCRCFNCSEQFQGDKRAQQCEPCAVKEQAEFDALTDEQKEERTTRNAEIINDFFNNWQP